MPTVGTATHLLNAAALSSRGLGAARNGVARGPSQLGWAGTASRRAEGAFPWRLRVRIFRNPGAQRRPNSVWEKRQIMAKARVKMVASSCPPQPKGGVVRAVDTQWKEDVCWLTERQSQLWESNPDKDPRRWQVFTKKNALFSIIVTKGWGGRERRGRRGSLAQCSQCGTHQVEEAVSSKVSCRQSRFTATATATATWGHAAFAEHGEGERRARAQQQ